MCFWIFMLIMDLLVPCAMIGFGKLFLNKAPQDINYTFGYRTTMSMKNRDTWQFAHKYCGRLWFVGGLILCPISIIPLLCVLGREIERVAAVGTVICFAQIVPLVGSIIPTEIALRRTFDKNGKRKIQ
ncbi:MAG: SdpI family protein [Lawsonibacter sp.]|nr:SdpI family protein [Lawsonibacter sp.]